MKTNHLHKYFIAISLFLIMAISVFIVLYRQIAINQKVANKIEAQWAGEVETQNKIKTLGHVVDEISKERDAFESHFARSSDIVPFLDTIEQLANSVSVKATINTVDITQVPSSLLIGIHGTGSFESIYKFMMLLENSSYEMELLSFDLRKDPDVISPVPNWNVTLRAKVLSFSNK